MTYIINHLISKKILEINSLLDIIGLESGKCEVMGSYALAHSGVSKPFVPNDVDIFVLCAGRNKFKKEVYDRVHKLIERCFTIKINKKGDNIINASVAERSLYPTSKDIILSFIFVNSLGGVDLNQIINSFDLTCCRFRMYHSNNILISEAVDNKILELTKRMETIAYHENPEATKFRKITYAARIRKYTARGFKIEVKPVQKGPNYFDSNYNTEKVEEEEIEEEEIEEEEIEEEEIEEEEIEEEVTGFISSVVKFLGWN
jgi:hypothetical protein